jgi:hypothetical protein
MEGFSSGRMNVLATALSRVREIVDLTMDISRWAVAQTPSTRTPGKKRLSFSRSPTSDVMTMVPRNDAVDITNASIVPAAGNCCRRLPREPSDTVGQWFYASRQADGFTQVRPSAPPFAHDRSRDCNACERASSLLRTPRRVSPVVSVGSAPPYQRHALSKAAWRTASAVISVIRAETLPWCSSSASALSARLVSMSSETPMVSVAPGRRRFFFAMRTFFVPT